MTGAGDPATATGIPAPGGQPGPVLVIADNRAIARRAPAWAADFVALGRVHRVRLVDRAASDLDALVAEAVSLRATAILAAGGAATRAAARAVAASLGLPLTVETDAADPAAH